MTNEPPPYPGSSGWGGQNPPPPPGAPGGYGVPAANHPKAVWSLVTGILSIVCCGPLGIVAIIIGNQAKGEIARAPGSYTGDGMAKAGVILGIIGLVLTVIGVIFYAIVLAGAASSGEF